MIELILQNSKPAPPTGSRLGFYAKADGFLYTQDVNGTEVQVGGSSIVPPPPSASNTVKVSASDLTAGFLEQKLIQGSGVTLTKSTGPNETITISVDTPDISASDVDNDSSAPGSTVADALTDHETRITANATSITANASNISSNASAITALDSRVTTNELNIASNSSAISTLQSDVSTIAGDLTALDTRVTTIEGNYVTTNTAQTITGAKTIDQTSGWSSGNANDIIRLAHSGVQYASLAKNGGGGFTIFGRDIGLGIPQIDLQPTTGVTISGTNGTNGGSYISTDKNTSRIFANQAAGSSIAKFEVFATDGSDTEATIEANKVLVDCTDFEFNPTNLDVTGTASYLLALDANGKLVDGSALTSAQDLDSVLTQGNTSTLGATFGADVTINDGNFLVEKTLGYGSSFNKAIRLGASNDTSVNVGESYKWDYYVSGDENGQDLSFRKWVRGGGQEEVLKLDSDANATFSGNIIGRKKPRITTVTSVATTLSVNGDTHDQYNITNQANAFTINAPTGTPVDGQKLIYRISDNGLGAWNITWNNHTAVGVTLPMTTINNSTKVLYVGCIYNSNQSRWDVIAVAEEV